MINVLISLLAFIFMLGLIVIIHELGHFLAARAFGIHCHEFSIGMGPAIYQRKGKNTIFSIRAIPLGGYVSIASDTGEYPEAEEAEDDAREVVDADYSEASDELKQEIPVLSDDKTKEKEADEEEDWNAKVPPEQKLDHRPAWQQVIVLLAGVTMNIVLALCLMAVFIGVRGYVPMPTEPVVAEVFENSPAQEGGLQPGDRIVKITAEDGSTVEPKELDDVTEFLVYNHGESVYTVLRDNQEVELKMTPQLNEESRFYLLGFSAAASFKEVHGLECIGYAWDELWDNTMLIFRSLGNLTQGKGTESLSGPVGIYKMTDQIVSYGWMPYIALCALISLNVGIFNLLPLPALDGGRIFILLFEKLFRKKMPRKAFEWAILGSYVLLFGLLIFATWNDIVNFFL